MTLAAPPRLRVRGRHLSLKRAFTNLVWNAVRLSYAQIWRSDEFDAQKTHDKFGSLTLAVRF